MTVITDYSFNILHTCPVPTPECGDYRSHDNVEPGSSITCEGCSKKITIGKELFSNKPGQITKDPDKGYVDLTHTCIIDDGDDKPSTMSTNFQFKNFSTKCGFCKTEFIVMPSYHHVRNALAQLEPARVTSVNGELKKDS